MEEILRVDLGELKVDVKKFDLVKKEIDVDKVSMSNSVHFLSTYWRPY